MEGLNRAQPGALLPYVWAPGWNSNQSLHKFQAEVGGHLQGGTAGARLLQAGNGVAPELPAIPMAFQPEPGHWQLVPVQRIFGSDELSALSPGIADLVEPGYLEINSQAASELGVKEGDGVEVDDSRTTLEVRVNDTVAAGCAGYSAGLAGTQDLVPMTRVSLRCARDWQRRTPELIGTDGGGHD